MAWAILDTNVYIDHWRGRLSADALVAIRAAFVVRHSAVVLSELRRGARTEAETRLVDGLRGAMTACWEPTKADWWAAGALVLAVGDEQGWDTAKRRDFQNDALIALTARAHGSTVVTTNRADFDLLARRLGIQVIVPDVLARHPQR